MNRASEESKIPSRAPPYAKWECQNRGGKKSAEKYWKN